jgi:hypothetical protein
LAAKSRSGKKLEFDEGGQEGGDGRDEDVQTVSVWQSDVRRKQE